jgi:ATP-dependent Clp protease ATP-binding subunit ClpB
MQPNNPKDFTEKAWQVITRTLDVAKQAKHQQMETEHLLKSLLEQDGLAIDIFTKAGADVPRLREKVEQYIKVQPKVGNNTNVYLGKALDVLFDRSVTIKTEFKDKFISIEHLILSCAQDDRLGKKLFRECNLTQELLYKTIKQIRGIHQVTDQNPENKYAALTKYGRDLTEAAKYGQLDPVIGREKEIRDVIGILSRRTKSSPLLTGEIGVGKTAIIEAIAQRIVDVDVPPSLAERTIISLNMGELSAGLNHPGELEERLNLLLKRIVESQGNIILFIDEIHTVTDDSSSPWAISIKYLLRSAIEIDSLRCIAITTTKKYSQSIEQYDFLRSCFNRIIIDELTIVDAISALRGLKEHYELHHGVRISDNAVVAAVNLSSRYISDQFLPDKAIDLMDEAAAKLKMEITSKPKKLDEIDHRILQIEMERLSVNKDTSREAKERLKRLEKELAEFKVQQGRLNTQWQSEKNVITQIQKIKEEIDRVEIEAQQAEREYDLNRAAELKYGKLTVELYKSLEEAEEYLANAQTSGKALLREEVTELDIAQIIADRTSIAMDDLLRDCREESTD